jgi:TPR repeat protein
MLEHGEGGPRDPAKAREWSDKAEAARARAAAVQEAARTDQTQ